MACPTCAACEFKKIQEFKGFQNFGDVAKSVLETPEAWPYYITEYAKLVVEGKA